MNSRVIRGFPSLPPSSPLPHFLSPSSNIDRRYLANLTLGNGHVITGMSFGVRAGVEVANVPLVDASATKNANVRAEELPKDNDSRCNAQ